MRVSWTEPALDDMTGIQAYIAKDSLYYARQFTERIFDASEKLEDFPELGRTVPEAGGTEHIRELLFQSYRIIYLESANLL
jgi:plasmid stabilization system protein ParE